MSRIGFLPGTAQAQLTALLLYVGALPVAMSLTLLTDWRTFFIYTMMWPLAMMRSSVWRTCLLVTLIPLALLVLGQLVRPPQASFFMLCVLILSACEQVQDDGRPGAFTFIGVFFPALCVMVLSTNILVFLVLLVSLIFSTGVCTLRMNNMPLSGLRVRWLPILMGLSGSLFFAITAFVLMPRFNVSTLPGFQQEAAFSGVGEELDIGRFSDVIENGEDAFRAFVSGPMTSQDLYWRVHVLTHMQGARWVRAPLANETRSRPNFTARLGAVSTPIEYVVHHVTARPKWHPVLGVPMQADVDAEARLNPQGEFVASRPLSVLRQQVKMRAALDNPFAAELDTHRLIDGQPRLAAWARETYARAGSRREFVRVLLEQFRRGGFTYTLSPPGLGRDDSRKLDQFFFATKQGYCSHYAMAMATALRAAGIPANVVVGYAGGEWNSFGKYYRVRQSDAHAWVEVEMAAGQWQRFDPTQFVPDARLRFGARQQAAATIEYQQGWRGNVARGLQRFDAFVVRLNSDIVLYDEAARQELLSGNVPSWLLSFVTFWLLTSLAFLAPLLLWRMWARRDPLLRLDQRFEGRARKYGISRFVYEGRMDFARRWQANAPEISEEIEACAVLICRMMFAPHSVSKNDSYRRVAGHLRAIGRHRGA